MSTRRNFIKATVLSAAVASIGMASSFAAHAADTIKVGAVVRMTETDFNLVECFDPVSNQCRLSSHCRLKGVLERAMQAYLAELDRVTLADLIASQAPGMGLQAVVTLAGPMRKILKP